MPETHTFILSVDEVTVTLEDIAHIFGLSIDGEVVNEAEHRVFGNEPIVSSFSKSYIKLALVCRIRDAEPLDTLNSIQRYVKCQIFYLLGSTVFADKSTAYTHAKYLPLLRDFQWIHTYSWEQHVSSIFTGIVSCNTVQLQEDRWLS
ncbi:hypothetical protein AHAS_Ahas17G0196300 [Arachis hypogaea]